VRCGERETTRFGYALSRPTRRVSSDAGGLCRFSAKSTRVPSRLIRGGLLPGAARWINHLLLWDRWRRYRRPSVRNRRVRYACWRWDDPAAATYTKPQSIRGRGSGCEARAAPVWLAPCGAVGRTLEIRSSFTVPWTFALTPSARWSGNHCQDGFGVDPPGHHRCSWSGCVVVQGFLTPDWMYNTEARALGRYGGQFSGSNTRRHRFVRVEVRRPDGTAAAFSNPVLVAK